MFVYFWFAVFVRGYFMKPGDKVCTFEQAKKLVDLGVILETEKYWSRNKRNPYQFKLVSGPVPGELERLPAPDVAEFGELLPFDECFGAAWYSGQNERGEWYCHAYNDGEEFSSYSDNEAQSRCAVLIWLIENGYLKL